MFRVPLRDVLLRLGSPLLSTKWGLFGSTCRAIGPGMGFAATKHEAAATYVAQRDGGRCQLRPGCSPAKKLMHFWVHADKFCQVGLIAWALHEQMDLLCWDLPPPEAWAFPWLQALPCSLFLAQSGNTHYRRLPRTLTGETVAV